jgi:hypothetical protein
MAKMGRPSQFTPKIGADICERIAQGKSMVTVCKEIGFSYTSVQKWLRDYPDFATSYARAREDQADFHADEIVAIADEEEDPQRAKVRIDARKWVAAKMRPKKYGDRVTQEHTGADGGPMVIVTGVPRAD